MPSNMPEQRRSRRAFLGAVTAGATSLALVPGEKPAAEAAAAEPARSTVRDHFWIFTVSAGLDNPSLELGKVRGGSRMTPAEGAFYLNIPNLLLIRSNNLPRLPDSEHGRAKTSFQQYATSFRPLDRVVWSVVGSGGQGGMSELPYVLSLAKEFPNLGGIYLDDFIIDRKKQADGRMVGRPALRPGELHSARERLKSVGRAMDIWVTLYSHEVNAKHPGHIGCDPPLANFLDLFDVLTLWTWNANELAGLETSLAALERIAPKQRRIALGMYIWDYPNSRPVPLELMQHQCELGLKWLKEKRIQELIFLANTVLDIGLPSAEFARNWIAKVGRATRLTKHVRTIHQRRASAMMKEGNEAEGFTATPADYADHVQLWADELKSWMPPIIFDAHVHLGPPEVMGPLSAERRKLPLATFSHLTFEALEGWYRQVFSGKRIAGLIAFPFPLQEVDIDGANRYILELMKREPRVKGFALAHPTDAGRTIAILEKARQEGVRFAGIKPYFDLLGKSVFACAMSEFIPEALLRLMDRERLILMLHTSRTGMGEKENQDYLRDVLERFPGLRIILAHMGRYLAVEEFFRFCDSGLLDYPTLYLEMSSASRQEVYARLLGHAEILDRLLFGSDLPFGLITGVEAGVVAGVPIFLTRERYLWSSPTLQEVSGLHSGDLTYNTYHTIKAFKDALDGRRFSAEHATAIKEAVFYRNAACLF